MPALVDEPGCVREESPRIAPSADRDASRGGSEVRPVAARRNPAERRDGATRRTGGEAGIRILGTRLSKLLMVRDFWR